MEAVGGPDAKKARWSPTSFANGLAAPNAASAAASAQGSRDAFANYGYGPQGGLSAANGFAGSPSAGFAAAAAAAQGNALYSTPTLSVNTAVATNGMGQQMSPNTAGPYTPQSQQPPSATPNSANPYGGFNGYSMLGMGLPAMNVLGGFAYNGQMAANFAQVCVVSPLFCCFVSSRFRPLPPSAAVMGAVVPYRSAPVAPFPQKPSPFFPLCTRALRAWFSPWLRPCAGV